MSSTGDVSHSPPITNSEAAPTLPRAQEPVPVAGSAGQQTSGLSPSQRLWNQAYDSLENDSDTANLVRAYVKTLTTVLAAETTPQTSDSGPDASTEPKDIVERERHMRKLVEEGQAKVATAYRITKGLGDVAKFVLSAKAMIDLAVQNIPQAALPWAGVCVGLQVSTLLYS